MAIDIRRTTTGLLLSAVLLTGCEHKYSLDLPLAVDSRLVELKSAEGGTKVLVYSTHRWDCSLTPECDWAGLDKNSGKGDGDIYFSYTANEGVARTVGIALATKELRDTMYMHQAGRVSIPSFMPSQTIWLISAQGEDCETSVSTNLAKCIGRITAEVDYGDGPTGWVSIISITQDRISFSVRANTSSSSRTARILFDIADYYDIQDPLEGSTISITQL